jgi:hypothetical protein
VEHVVLAHLLACTYGEHTVYDAARRAVLLLHPHSITCMVLGACGVAQVEEMVLHSG